MIDRIKNPVLRRAAVVAAYGPLMVLTVVLGALSGAIEYGRNLHAASARAWRTR